VRKGGRVIAGGLQEWEGEANASLWRGGRINGGVQGRGEGQHPAGRGVRWFGWVERKGCAGIDRGC
jgi:hypothetical protein